jgi:WD40 repeat protein
MTILSGAEAGNAQSRPASPYVGLVPFEEDDAQFFFGRSQEAAIVGANLRSTRLTLLYGESGVGKSSLLMAGVVHGLRNNTGASGRRRFAVCVFRTWLDDPTPGVEHAAHAVLQTLAGDEPLPPRGKTLTESLRTWTRQAGMLLIVLDQFEEYFQYHADEGLVETLTGFGGELVRIVNDPDLPVHVLLSIRGDAWSELDRFKGHIPMLFANYLRVDHLDIDAAREAIEGPIAAWNLTLTPGTRPYSIEPALTKSVLNATAGGGLTLTVGGETPAVHEAPSDRVEAPFLQLVLERLWRATVADGAHELTLARLKELGGAGQIVENHLLTALARLTPAEQAVVSDCVRFLVSRGKTKIAHPAADLAEWTQRTEPQVIAVLDKLCSGESGRILRLVPSTQDGGSPSYELFHDILAEPILGWRRTFEAGRSRRAARRRLFRIGGILLALVIVFGALGIVALVQRNEARNATSSAASLALVSAANDQLATRPDISLLLSLEAYRLRKTIQARSSMISALETARRSGTTEILHGHAGPVRGIALSPDGATLASVGDDGTVRLWDVGKRTQLGQPLLGHIGSVDAVAFSPNGAMVASGGDDGTVRLWDVRAGKPLGQPLIGHAGPVTGVAFSPDGTMLASAGDDGTVRLWDVRTHKQLGRSLTGHKGNVLGVAFSPDGAEVASAGLDKTVRLWNVSTHQQLGQPLLGHEGPVVSVAFSPDGATLASAGYDNAVRLWDVATHHSLGVLRAQAGPPVYAVAFAPDGATLASANNDGTVRLWDVHTHRQLGEPLYGHTGPVRAVAFGNNDATVASGSDDGTVRLWDWRNDPDRRLYGHRGAVESVAFSPDGATLASAGFDGTVLLWGVRTGKQLGQRLRPRVGRTYPVRGIAFSPDGATLASAGNDGTVRLWDLRTHEQVGRSLKPLLGRTKHVFGVAFSPDGSTLASADDDGTVRLWDVRTHNELGGPLSGHIGPVGGVAFSPDGSTLASAGFDKTVRLWDVRTHEPLGRPLSGHTGPVEGVAFSPDGVTLASASFDGTVRLWNMRTHKQLGEPLSGHIGPVVAAAFSPDGSMLASVGNDGTVRLWDVRTHKQLGLPLSGHAGPVVGVAFSPDGTMVASADDDGTVRLWDVIRWRNFDDLKQQVCRLMAGNLTEAEWQDLVPGVAYHVTCPS